MSDNKRIVVVVVVIVIAFIILHLYFKNDSGSLLSIEGKEVSIIVGVSNTLTFKSLKETLRAIRRQKTNFDFDVVVVDKYCVEGIKGLLDLTLFGVPSKLVQLCDAPEDIISPYDIIAHNNSRIGFIQSKWLLFVQSGVVFKSNFLQNLMDATKINRDTEASGCKLITYNESNLLSVGSILWSDGSIYNYGLKEFENNVNADEISYARQVDIVSDSCLFINRGVFDDSMIRTRADSDTAVDLQIKLSVEHKKKIMYNPIAVGYTLLDTPIITDLSDNLKEKWTQSFSLFQDASVKEMNETIRFLQARDNRQRQPGSISILYIDDRIPNRYAGSGYGRAVDNLHMIRDLGHSITIKGLYDEGCDTECKQTLQKEGFEIIYQTKLDELLKARDGLYEIVLVSRPSTYTAAHDTLHKYVSKLVSSLMYDAEALWYRRDMKLMDLISYGYDAPGAIKFKETFDKTHSDETREIEIALLQDPDVITTVSELERSIILDLTKETRNPFVEVIGHVMELNDPTPATFHERLGILFLASYGKQMYYNGDAIWGFLKSVYQEVLLVSPTLIPITIAGRGIPQELFDFVSNCTYCQNVTLLESPKDIRVLYNQARLFIAPHKYGAGVQYKLSEAFAAGVPVVMSADTAMNMGFLGNSNHSAGCIGDSSSNFRTCVLSAHNDPAQWNRLREQGMEFIKQTHQMPRLRELWRGAITEAIKRLRRRQECQTDCETLPGMGFKALMTKRCREKESSYLQRYSSVNALLLSRVYISGTDHFMHTNPSEGFLFSLEDENQYLTRYRDAKMRVDNKEFVSGWHFFKEVGGKRGDIYSPEDEARYAKEYTDIKNAIESGSLKTGWIHYDLWGGKNEHRHYGCF